MLIVGFSDVARSLARLRCEDTCILPCFKDTHPFDIKVSAPQALFTAPGILWCSFCLRQVRDQKLHLRRHGRVVIGISGSSEGRLRQERDNKLHSSTVVIEISGSSKSRLIGVEWRVEQIRIMTIHNQWIRNIWFVHIKGKYVDRISWLFVHTCWWYRR